MSLTLSPWQALLLLALASLGIWYATCFQIWTTRAPVHDALFLAALAVMVMAIAAPALFDSAARELVERSPLPAALDEVDDRARAIATLPDRLLDGARTRLGMDLPPVQESNRDGLTSPESPSSASGILSARLRPSVDRLVALLLRLTTAGLAGGTLALAALLRISRALALRVSQTARRLERLESGFAAFAAGDSRRSHAVTEANAL